MAAAWCPPDHRHYSPSWEHLGLRNSHLEGQIADDCDILVYWYGKRYSISQLFTLFILFLLIYFISLHPSSLEDIYGSLWPMTQLYPSSLLAPVARMNPKPISTFWPSMQSDGTGVGVCPLKSMTRDFWSAGRKTVSLYWTSVRLASIVPPWRGAWEWSCVREECKDEERRSRSRWYHLSPRVKGLLNATPTLSFLCLYNHSELKSGCTEFPVTGNERAWWLPRL